MAWVWTTIGKKASRRNLENLQRDERILCMIPPKIDGLFVPAEAELLLDLKAHVSFLLGNTHPNFQKLKY